MLEVIQAFDLPHQAQRTWIAGARLPMSKKKLEESQTQPAARGKAGPLASLLQQAGLGRLTVQAHCWPGLSWVHELDCRLGLRWAWLDGL